MVVYDASFVINPFSATTAAALPIYLMISDSELYSPFLGTDQRDISSLFYIALLTPIPKGLTEQDGL